LNPLSSSVFRVTVIELIAMSSPASSGLMINPAYRSIGRPACSQLTIPPDTFQTLV
jgi:hypothetical protein